VRARCVAVLGPGIENRHTRFGLDETERLYRQSGDPWTEELIELLREPRTPAEAIADCESRVFSG
jgi:hypothetical protein